MVEWFQRGQTSRAVFRFISGDFIQNEVQTLARIMAVECKCTLISLANRFLYFYFADGQNCFDK